MKYVLELIVLFSIILIGCSEKSLHEEKNKAFQIPVIVNHYISDSLESEYFTENSIVEANPILVGKFKFCDSISLIPGELNPSFFEDIILDYQLKGAMDSLDTNGLEIIPAYSQIISFPRHNADTVKQTVSKLYTYYPLYLINSTSHSKLVLTKNGLGYGIQEAYDTISHAWFPIEGRRDEYCGVGEWGLILRPKEFAIFLVRRYNGSFNTNLRFRFANGESVFVTKSFKGFINYHQFSLDKSSGLNRSIVESKGLESSRLFYGAVPKQVWLAR